MRYLTELTLAGLLPSPEARNEVLGDLTEEEQHHREHRGRRRASAWYYTEATRTAAQLIARGIAARPRDVVTSLLAGALVMLAIQGLGTVLAVVTVLGWPWPGGLSLRPNGLIVVVATAPVLGAVAGGATSALLARCAPLVPVAWLAMLAALSSPLLESVMEVLASAPEIIGWPAALLPSPATTTLTLAITAPVAILLGGLGAHLFLEALYQPGRLSPPRSRPRTRNPGVGFGIMAALFLSPLLAAVMSPNFGGWTGGGMTMLSIALAAATTSASLLAHHRRSTLRQQLDTTR
ncbi:hypothetical protein [Cellulomonas sp. NS3]|uniref:hypothetical protein n=1 Tax=Cellulomonas sp. NS3 TaxID=2973977 RepID=UPI0021629D17|nr:hypothetical protein [Cellulomonas sp. NS3]